jgi:transposase
MQRRHELSTGQWQKLKKVIPGGIGRPPTLSTRRFINAVLWKVKTGVPWRDLPKRYGSWKTVYSRFRRWALAGHFLSIFEVLQIEVDDDFNAIDGTYIRVHQHAAGGKGGPTNSALEEVVADSLRRCMHVWMLKERRGNSK